ncbi:MAG TPA: hypothetical protein ENN05_13080 [Deltaproteobacteria bacterium]|nr:hypothetical protein [Deltaproteobacteria bacterium]
MDERIIPAGKLPADLLARLLGEIPLDDPNILVGPALGEDATAIRFADQILLFKTDPITFASDKLAWYLVTINVNDIACMGGIPKYLLATFLLPEGKTSRASVEKLFSDLQKACTSYNITLVGGHTEITYGINRPIAIGFMIGTLAGDTVIRTSGAGPGDLVLLTKSIPIEGIAVMAQEKADKLGLDSKSLEKARNLIYDPGISVLKDAQIALAQGGVTAMHDPTEGGLATGLHEIAAACGYGITVKMESIPILNLAQEILPRLAIDPLGVLASGSLVVCCKEGFAGKILSAWKKNGIPGSIIGKITHAKEMILVHEGRMDPLPEFTADEITKMFSS